MADIQTDKLVALRFCSHGTLVYTRVASSRPWRCVVLDVRATMFVDNDVTMAETLQEYRSFISSLMISYNATLHLLLLDILC
jgi:hypothetical protein